MDIQVLEAASDLLEKLPQPITPLVIPVEPVSSIMSGHSQSLHQSSNSYCDISPLWVFLASEASEMNVKICDLKSSLNDLVRRVKGGFVSEAHVYEALSRNMVPFQWKVSFQCFL